MGRLNAGQLRERLTLFTPAASVPDGVGGWLPGGAETSVTVWARLRPLRAAEKVANGQQLNSEAYEATIRVRPGVAGGLRAEWRGQTLRIQAVTPDEAGEYLTLLCYDNGQ